MQRRDHFSSMQALGTDRTRPARSIIAVAGGLCLIASGCGAISEKIAEEGIERAIESESGENVELDFDRDGGLSIETEDGSLSVNEDGEFVVTDQNGSVFTGSADGDGLTVTDENGNEIIDIDADGDSGVISIDGEEATYRVVTDVPEEWPGDVPRPESLTFETGSYANVDGETIITLVGMPSGDVGAFISTYGDALVDAGLNETSRFDQESDGVATAQRTNENDDWVVSITSFSDGSGNSITITLVSASV
jgi:hypothetical protein